MDALFGYTGFVGSNILQFKKFDKLYRSTNVEEAKNMEFNEVFFCSLPGTKWLANKFPDDDKKILNQCINVISTIKAKKFILVSTIDVYEDVRCGLDEDYDLTNSKPHNYGKHRLIFENFIKNKFDNYYIFRIPALFGRGLKKNVLYDLIHNHEVYKININSIFQWYNLEWLEEHFNICFKNNIRICNLFSEPLETTIIANLFNYKYNDISSIPIKYNLKTKYCKFFNNYNGYICDKNHIIDSIKNYINNFI